MRTDHNDEESQGGSMKDGSSSAELRNRIEPRSTLTDGSIHDIGTSLRVLLADVFALYLKTKNFHWHMRGPHFRDYHLLLDEQGDQLFAMSDVIAERSRKIDVATIHSVGEIARLQRISDNDSECLLPETMLAALFEDNRQLTASLREAHSLCDQTGDLATASLLEPVINFV
jgi:starvation-inducible DNA-binding protein